MIAIAAGVLLLFGAMQKAVLRELYNVLYKKNNAVLYLSMLDSRQLCLVMRKGTIALLRLDGYLYLGDSQGISRMIMTLDRMWLKPAERLSYLQKRLSYYVTEQDKAEAEETLVIMRNLLQNEKNAKLKAGLHDAELLVGVYIRHETALIDTLLEKSEGQSGNARGITEYQLAKLYWYSGSPEKAEQHLALAGERLKGTVWQKCIDAALENNRLLEVR